MKKRQAESHGQQRCLEFQQEPLLVSDILSYLSGLAQLQDVGRTGNPELSEGLRILVQALRSYANCPAKELNKAIQGKAASQTNIQTSSQKSNAVFPTEFDAELETIGWTEVEEFLSAESSTKRQVVELGFRRFAISRSSLERLNKQDAVATVRAALENEKSLDVISREAVRTGKARAG
ncbi:MAG: hypothetical protein OXI91_05205 [Chloroflexota bacterium]|nr:hypothetical protein [Chloroflexota bacterium]